jgi:hypothetical protein
MTTSEAVIYLAEARTCTQDNHRRSYQTLKQPFFDLTAFNDETLAPGASARHVAPALIIPLVGDVITTERLEPGSAQMVVDHFDVTNPYKEELVNYLCISFGSGAPATITNLNLEQNSLKEIINGRCYMGEFDGRHDDVYKLSEKAAGVFVFAIEGAFEVANRLLQPRDGLGLWNIKEVEFEALSSDAILLIVEVF